MKTPALAMATLRGTTWISTDGLRELGRRDRIWVLPVAGLGIAVGVAVIVFMLVGVYISLLAGGQAIGHPELVMFYGVMGSWAFLFITAIPLVLSVLYYSNDLRMLLTLPVRPLQIVLGKSLLLYGYCFPVNVVLLVPALVVYAGTAGASTAVVVSSIVHLFLTPLLPLSLAALLVIGLMKVVNLSRHRLAFEVAGMALGIVALVGLQVILSRTTMASLRDGGAQTLGSLTGTWDRLSGALPPLGWAAAGFVAGSGPLPLVLDLLVTAAAATLALVLAPLNFLHDVMERREAGARKRGREAGARKRGRAAAVADVGAPRSVARQLVGREWAILSSNSTFIFEAVGELLVLPLVLGVYGLILPKQIIAQAMQLIASMPVLGIAVMGVLVLMTSLTTVSATSISREGPRLALSLTLPVRGSVQVRAKMYFHLLFFSTAYVADLAIVWVLFRFPLPSLVFIVPGGIALQIVAFTVSIFFDLKRPFLKWTHPQQAMKNNINALSGIGGSAAITALVTAPFALLALSGFNQLIAGCLAAAVAVALAVILVPRLMAFADRQYSGGLESGG